MTILPYQVDSVLRLYTRQNNAKGLGSVAKQGSDQVYLDKVTLGSEAGSVEKGKSEAYEKISYSLLDIILSDKEEK